MSGLTDLKTLKICDEGTLPEAEQTKIDKSAKQAAQKLVDAGKYPTVDAAMGEALFNLDINSGAYSCARCHTQGWSYGSPGVPGQGAFGWNLTGGSTASHFPSEQDMIDFIKTGSELGQRYGKQSQGTGRMPGLRQPAHRRADQGHRRIRAEPVMSALLAIGWQPELRGILITIIAVIDVLRQLLLPPQHQPRGAPRLPRGASPRSPAGCS